MKTNVFYHISLQRQTNMISLLFTIALQYTQTKITNLSHKGVRGVKNIYEQAYSLKLTLKARTDPVLDLLKSRPFFRTLS